MIYERAWQEPSMDKSIDMNILKTNQNTFLYPFCIDIQTRYRILYIIFIDVKLRIRLRLSEFNGADR